MEDPAGSRAEAGGGMGTRTKHLTLKLVTFIPAKMSSLDKYPADCPAVFDRLSRFSLRLSITAVTGIKWHKSQCVPCYAAAVATAFGLSSDHQKNKTELRPFDQSRTTGVGVSDDA